MKSHNHKTGTDLINSTQPIKCQEITFSFPKHKHYGDRRHHHHHGRQK